MINVIAAIRVQDGRRHEFLEIFKALVPSVAAENGCHTYCPAVDVASGLPIQASDPDVVTVIERWESLEALKAHLEAAHMAVFRDQTKDLVINVSLKVLRDA